MPSGYPVTPNFGESVAINAQYQTATVCDAVNCYVYGTPGTNWEWIYTVLGSSAPPGSIQHVVDGPFVSDPGSNQHAFGFLANGGTCGASQSPCQSYWLDDFTANYPVAGDPVPAGMQTAGAAAVQDGYLLGFTGGAQGVVQVYSSGFIKGAGIQNWQLTPNQPPLPSTPTPTANFGAQVAASAGYVFPSPLPAALWTRSAPGA